MMAFGRRNYNLWTMEKMPVILVLFDASRSRAFSMRGQRMAQRDEP